MSKKDLDVSTGAEQSSRRLVVGATAGLLIGAGALAVLLNTGGPVTSSHPLLAQAPGIPGGPPAGAPGAPGRPAPGARPGAPGTPKSGPTNSFSDAPPAYQALQGGGGQAAAAPNPYGGGPTTGASAAPTTGTKPAPVKQGATASGFRKDPFVSYRIQPYQKPPAYSFLAPYRVADYPQPPKPKPNPDPNIEFGPLPYVPRRVAGVLFRGGVSAILETGGLGGDTQIVRPGSQVPSGIAGVSSLTVASITATQLTLRAPDGRTTSVDLSASPTGTPSVGGGFGGSGSDGPGGGGGLRGGGLRGGGFRGGPGGGAAD